MALPRLAALRAPCAVLCSTLALASASLLASLGGCSSGRGPQSSPALEWRLVPSTTVLGDRRQFFVYGKSLNGAVAASDPTVKIEPGAVKGSGETFSLYLTVSSLGNRAADSTVFGEKPGLRKIEVKTPDTTVAFFLKVLDER